LSLSCVILTDSSTGSSVHVSTGGAKYCNRRRVYLSAHISQKICSDFSVYVSCGRGRGSICHFSLTTMQLCLVYVLPVLWICFHIRGNRSDWLGVGNVDAGITRAGANCHNFHRIRQAALRSCSTLSSYTTTATCAMGRSLRLPCFWYGTRCLKHIFCPDRTALNFQNWT